MEKNWKLRKYLKISNNPINEFCHRKFFFRKVSIGRGIKEMVGNLIGLENANFLNLIFLILRFWKQKVP
jgi:hypothetical protein